MDFTPSARTQDLVERVRAFVEGAIAPVEDALARGPRPSGDWRTWSVDPRVEITAPGVVLG